jgi:hypothetical protein
VEEWWRVAVFGENLSWWWGESALEVIDLLEAVVDV